MNVQPDHRESDLRRAKALGDRTRRAIWDALCDAAGPLDVVALTGLVGTHHTAVRQHLAKLEDAGLVLEERLQPSGVGRPRLGYRAVREPVDGLPYRTLATLLASTVRSGLGPRAVGRTAGRRELDVADAGDTDVPVERLAAHAQRLGFEPEVRRGRAGRHTIVLHACPFADAAAEAPEVVCDLHLGIAEGLADSIGGIGVDALRPGDPHRAGCRLEVRELPSPTTSSEEHP